MSFSGCYSVLESIAHLDSSEVCPEKLRCEIMDFQGSNLSLSSGKQSDS
jgi:hypothetical protein